MRREKPSDVAHHTCDSLGEAMHQHCRHSAFQRSCQTAFPHSAHFLKSSRLELDKTCSLNMSSQNITSRVSPSTLCIKNALRQKAQPIPRRASERTERKHKIEGQTAKLKRRPPHRLHTLNLFVQQTIARSLQAHPGLEIHLKGLTKESTSASEHTHTTHTHTRSY